MTDELRDAIESAFFPYITDPDKRWRLADLAARIAYEHAATTPCADVPSPSATNPRECT